MSDSTLETPAVPDSIRSYRALLARYLRPQALRVVWMSVFLLAGITVKLINPQILRGFLDAATTGAGSQSLLSAGLLFIFFAIVQQAMSLATHYTVKSVGWTATNRLRADLARHLLRLDMSFHKSRTPGELIDRVDGDVTQLANFLSSFSVNILGDSLLVIGILALLFREDTWVGLGMVVYTLLTLFVLRRVQALAVPRWAAERIAGTALYGYIEERISGAEEIRAAGAEPYAMRRLYALMRTFTEKTRTALVVSQLTYNLTSLVYVLGYAAGLSIGVILYTRGLASLGTAYLITYYISMLSDPLQSIRAQVEDLQQAAASIQRVQELFDLQPRVSDPLHDVQDLPEAALSVTFERVSFRYDDRLNGSAEGENGHVLSDVSLNIQPGRVLGILGRTGSGKSTLTRLLFRLYDPNQGHICLSGVDLRQVPLNVLRRRVGMVTQEVQLFEASVRENLTFFRKAHSVDESFADAHLHSVLRELRLWDWVQSLPNGLDTPLSAGQSLSAGEAQLLAFARVFLKDPGLVILDEASSRLDPSTEALMEQAVDRLFAGRTGVVIAHRLKTVQRADDILILENGCVVEYGPRQALAADPTSRFAHLLRTGLEEALA